MISAIYIFYTYFLTSITSELHTMVRSRILVELINIISYCAVVFGMNTLYEWKQTRQLRAESNKS